jgi:hypothetical protein
MQTRIRRLKTTKYFLAIIAVILVIAIILAIYAYELQVKIPPVPALTTFATPSSYSLAIGTVSVLPTGANYSLGAEFPDGSRFLRFRAIDATGNSSSQMVWDSQLNANQILYLINQTRPQVLERMTAGVFNWTANVRVCSGCAPMTYGQFLNASMAVCACYIIPRLDISGVSLSTFLSEAQYLLNAPVFPRFQILSIDNWGSYCATNRNCTCSVDSTIFLPLYAIGWKGIGVLNAATPYWGTCGYATYVDFDASTNTWSVNQPLYYSIRADPSVQKILYYDPDFPGQAQTLLSTCNPSCNQIASVIQQAAAEQSTYGITYVYPILQNFWDSTSTVTSGGKTIYSLEQTLMNTYNNNPPAQTITI